MLKKVDFRKSNSKIQLNFEIICVLINNINRRCCKSMLILYIFDVLRCHHIKSNDCGLRVTRNPPKMCARNSSGKHVREIYTKCTHFNPTFIFAKLGFAGVYRFFLFLLQNIDCGYSLEPPRLINQYFEQKY